MRIDLGTANPAPPGFDWYIDKVQCPNVPNGKMCIWNLDNPWPMMESSVDYIRAHDIIEHLHNKILTMNELWRCLKPNALVEIVVPTTDGMGAWQDPTHVSYWNRNSFTYFTKDHPNNIRFSESYGIAASFQVIAESLEDTQDGTRLTILLKAIK